MERKTLTTSSGMPVDSNQNSLTAGPRGPILLQDFHLIDKLAKFDRERIPERVVHAKGAGAHGYLEVTHDVSKFCKAKFLNSVGKRTPLFLRFSTVAGENGSADTVRDPRGFAIKFYTEEGNYDMVGNNTPVFFIKDPMKFPDFIHSQKRNPQTNLNDPNMAWDFWTYTTDSLHQITILFSDRGTPDGYRHMNGYSSHTYKWVNDKGEVHYVKYHFKTDQGIKNFTTQKAGELQSTNKDYATQDLFDNIAKGNFPSWTWYVQLIPEKEEENYKYDIFDVTKVVPHKDYPLIPVGKIVLNKNPENYFAEVEQSAFAPTHVVPGIEPSADRMLQGRLFSYPDTHRHRLGANYEQIPINCPYRARVANYQRDGPATVNGNQGSGPNYEPNSHNGPVEDPTKKQSQFTVSGLSGRYPHQHPNDDFEQPRALFRKVMTETDRANLISNICGSLGGARRDIQEKMIKLFYKVDPEYGERVAKGLGIPAHLAKI
jgi:catalase